MSATRWNLVVSSSTDSNLREFLALHGDRKEDLSRFVEEAVQAHILELSTAQAKTGNSSTPPEEIDNAVTEALNWARRI